MSELDDAARLAERGEFLTLLSADDRALLAAQGRRRRYARGASLLVEGTRSEAVLVLLSGRVKISSTTSHGVEAVLAVRGPGALLGEMAALDDRPRSATVVALEPVVVLSVPIRAFSEFLATRAQVALVLLRAITTRLRDADRKRVEFGGFDTVSRVARRLVEMADRFGEAEPRGLRIGVPITQDDLAGWVGGSREAVVKALRSLRARGWIVTQRRTVVVTDLAALRRRAGTDAAQ